MGLYHHFHPEFYRFDEKRKLTRVAMNGADELQRNTLAEELVEAIDNGSVELQNVLLHQHHRAFDFPLLAAIVIVVVASQGSNDALHAFGNTAAATTTAILLLLLLRRRFGMEIKISQPPP
ncbi:unnamed protein product [Linum trigynum]|uniref:Uncharacterized protein n=1 Tax=Linum trigynum TaxID=586398 RepID=A0AAV2G142_9ROSI